MESTTITPQNEQHRAVLDLLCKGHPRKEIASTLQVSYESVCAILTIYRAAARVQTDTGLALAIMEERWKKGEA